MYQTAAVCYAFKLTVYWRNKSAPSFMKCICWTALILSCLSTTAQKTESYYDYAWRPCEPVKARFYSTLEKTDSGWLRYDYFLAGLKLQMKALFADSACKLHNGQSIYVYANGQVSSIGRQLYNKQMGVCVSYHSNGMMSDSATYSYGRPVGIKMGWWPNGATADSVAHVNDSMDIEISWFDNGVPSQAGFWLNGNMHGKWKFFHRNGQLAALEMYDHGKALSKSYFKEDGSVQMDTSYATKNFSFQKGDYDWMNWLSKKLYWPDGYQFTNGDQAVVVLQITLNEEGKPENVEVATPFHPAFDKIALDIVRRSPNWNPRISHNRKIKAVFRQPITFRQEEN